MKNRLIQKETTVEKTGQAVLGVLNSFLTTTEEKPRSISKLKQKQCAFQTLVVLPLSKGVYDIYSNCLSFVG